MIRVTIRLFLWGRVGAPLVSGSARGGNPWRFPSHATRRKRGGLRVELYHFAVRAALCGWAVFPLRPNGKEPWPGLRWRERSCSDPQRVLDFAAANPDANWGCDLGKSDLFVLDIDCKRKTGGGYTYEPAGYDSLLALVADHPDCPAEGSTVGTGNGGLHWFLQQPAEPVGCTPASGFRPGIDVKGAGGYAVIPDSVIAPDLEHPLAVGSYRPEAGLMVVPQVPPPWLLEAIRPPRAPVDRYTAASRTLTAAKRGAGGVRGHLERLVDEVACARHPGRNEALNTAAFKMREELASGLIGAGEVVRGFMGACGSNGLLREDGERACLATIVSGLGVSEGNVTA